MTYGDFSLRDIYKKFGIANKWLHLFDNLSSPTSAPQSPP